MTTLVFLSTMLILSGCNSTPSNVTKEIEMGLEQVQESESNLPQKLPTPTIQSESGISIPAIQGSYCWGGACADYASLNFEDNTPVQVLVGETLSIDMGIDIPPDEINISEYVNKRNQSITSTEGTFQLPKEPGTHYYSAFLRWSSPQDSQISLGDTSFTFVVHVVESK
ncbi:hypothetical protein MKY66_05355 [Paenibacillus sp. FSL R5-0766]|uniref:hypothetical protein n=1 Tax=Paenibacillus sp. FSL R5-0766 TaxID=2921658 RepID=UPI0030D841D6